MKNRQKALSVLLTLAIAVGLLPWAATPARAEDAVPYVYYTADDGALTKHTDGSVTDYTPVTGQTVAWSAGWYVAAGEVTIDGRVTVTGAVNLILCDGATLTASKGVTVSGEGNSLTVYAQSDGDDMGALTATGSGYDAGIGGEYTGGDYGPGGAGGTVTVHGGAVTATGDSGADYGGAGIGGGGGSGRAGIGGTVTVYGGAVTATGGHGAAGIGGGRYEGNGGTVTVYGGTVTATGGNGGGAGIGGGHGGDGATVTVHDGTVIATGGKGGAGIGGGWGNNGGTVTINDGTVIATGGTYGAGIGGGNWGAGGAVEINGGTVTATGGEFNGSKGMGIGRGHNSENNGSLTIGEGVKLLTSDNNSSWTDATNNASARTQYMRTLSRAVACVTSGGTTTNYETLTAALDAWTDGTTLKLLADVETDSTITVGNGTDATSVTLDLNGHGIRAKASYSENPTLNRTFRVISVSDHAALTLEDTAASGTHRYITLGTIGGGADKVHGTAVSVVKPEGEAGTDYLAVTGGYITGGLAYDSSNSSNCDGGAVYVDSEGTFTMNGGTIAGNAAISGKGGGVYVQYKSESGPRGTFAMNGGTIAGNTAWNSGGGVYVNQYGRFNMSGGTIAGNTASSGGGVHLQYSAFTMTGGKIAGNTASIGGGVRADGSHDYPCTFTMSGNAEISGNKASSASGGVYVNQSTFEMSGNAAISGNTANGGGGVGVDHYGTFDMSGNARISSNESQNTSYGGGVFVTDSSRFTLNGGTVAGNTAYYGGGVYLSSGTLTLNGGTITGNNAASQGKGGGVGLDSGEGRTFNVSGAPVISGNKLGGTFENGVLTGGTANNVHLYGSMTVTVTGALTSGAKLGVSMETPGTFTSELANGGADALKCFTSDSGAYVVGLNGGEAELLASSFAENGKVTAPKGALLVCATYEGGKMTGVQTLTLAEDCIGKAASKLLNVPTSGQYKLFLLDGTTYAPLCAAWPNNNP